MQVDLTAMTGRQYRLLTERLNLHQQQALEEFVKEKSRTFEGKVANLDKVRIWKQMEEHMMRLREVSWAVLGGAFHEPSVHARNALMYVDISSMEDLEEESRYIINRMKRLADDMDVYDMGDCVRISFVLFGIWTDGERVIWEIPDT